MTGKELFHEIGMIDEKYIEEAENTKRSIIHNVVFRRSLATAACLVVCIGLYFGTKSTRENTPSAQDMVTNALHQESTVERKQDMGTDGLADEQMQNIMIDSESAQPEKEVDTTPPESLENSIDKTTEQGNSEAFDKVENPLKEELAIQEAVNTLGESNEQSDVQKRLDAYPYLYEELCSTSALVVLRGEVKSGMTYWESFLEAVSKNEECYVDVVNFTMEGNPIITCVEYNGVDFMVTVDRSRDNMTAVEKQFMQEKYLFLQTVEEDGLKKIVLSDEKNLTADKLQSVEGRKYLVVEYKQP